MRYFVVGDVHWCAYSSILRSRDEKRSTRLTYLLESVNWAEGKSRDIDCDAIVYLGDFFDKPDLTEEEITALTEVKWNKGVPHYFIVGNHESRSANLRFSSTSVFELLGLDFVVINEPTRIDDAFFVPYLNDVSDVDLVELTKGVKHPIVFSHNDISGIRYGQYESKSGFPIETIESLDGLFVNGHLHNHTKFERNGNLYAVNLGNLTGQNFSEDGMLYRHYAMSIENDEIIFYENPYAMMFYKLEINDDKGVNALDNLKFPAVLCVKCDEEMKIKVDDKIASLYDSVLAYKIIVSMKDTTAEVSHDVVTSVDHINRFREFVIERLGNTDTVRSELEEICK